MSRKKSYRSDKCESGSFVKLPVHVFNSPAYVNLSNIGKALLIEVVMQSRGDNNGRYLLSMKYLNARGWNSADVVTKAKRELIESKLIYQTVQGHRPNKASWYAVTWECLDKLNGFDEGAEAGFRRGAYNTTPLPKPKATREELFKKWEPAGKKQNQNHFVIPPGGIERAPIVPSGGIETRSPIPSGGTMEALLTPLPIPSGGNHLDIPCCTLESALISLRANAANHHDRHCGFDRVRESERDPAMYDPDTGEYFNRPSGKQKMGTDCLTFSTAEGD